MTDQDTNMRTLDVPIEPLPETLRHLPKAERRELDALLKAAQAHIDGLTPYRQKVLFKAARSVSPVNCGWQHYDLAKIFVYRLIAIATEARRAETAQTGSVHEGVDPKGIAHD
jgi:hypothetical protein